MEGRVVNNPPKAGEAYIFLYENNQYRIIGIKSFIERTVRELCNAPYVIRIDVAIHGRTYFAGLQKSLIVFPDSQVEVRQ